MIKKIFFIFLFILVLSYFVLNNNIGKEQTKLIQETKYLIPVYIKDFIKQNIFVHQYKSKLEKKITAQDKYISRIYSDIEKIFDYGNSFEFSETFQEELKIDNTKLRITKFTLPPLEFTGPRAYIQYHDKNLFLINGNGDLFYISKNNLKKRKIIFTKIKSNLKKITSIDKNEMIQVKDFLLANDKIYVSFLNKKDSQCFENKIIEGKISYEKITFETFFSTGECRKESTPSVGGNLSSFNKDKLLLTIGDYYCYERDSRDFCEKNLPQLNKSFMGKIISINKDTKNFEIMSKGHRNSQGIFYNKENDIIWSTDHGPYGGDEININLNPNDRIKNYGWPIASYGKHYEGPNLDKLYEIAPLKSHSEFNFDEPFIQFTPAIGISQIIKIENFLNDDSQELFVGSLGFNLEEGDLSLHYFRFDLNYNILSQEVIPIGERIRDLEFIADLNLIVLFLETSGSIAIIEKPY